MADIHRRGQLGINDSLLTVALEAGDFKEAERLILEHTQSGTEDPSFLNDGPYERTPLAILLSSDAELRHHPRHLRLAWLLVQNGADSNLRVPQPDLTGASASPMEEVAMLYLALQEVCRGKKGTVTTAGGSGIHDPLNTIGLGDEEGLTAEELRDQLVVLIDLFLGAGGDPNGTTTLGNSSLFHMVLAGSPTPDLPLVQRLCECGAKVNLSNVHGTTPMMDLALCEDGAEAVKVMMYLFGRVKGDLDICAENCVGETALWRAMFVGHSNLAVELLRRGADCSSRAVVEYRPRVAGMSLAHTSLSALLAPLLNDSRPFMNYSCVYAESNHHAYRMASYFHKRLVDKIVDSSVAPVVDAGFLNTSDIHDELRTLLTRSTYYHHLTDPDRVRPDSLVPLMFGRTSAGLRQLCVREIINHHVFDSGQVDLLKEISGMTDPVVDGDDVHKKIAYHMTPKCMKEFVQRLRLPKSLMVYFEVEAAKVQLSAVLHMHQSVDCTQNCEGDSDESMNDASDWEEEETSGSDYLSSGGGDSSSYEVESSSWSDGDYDNDETDSDAPKSSCTESSNGPNSNCTDDADAPLNCGGDLAVSILRPDALQLECVNDEDAPKNSSAQETPIVTSPHDMPKSSCEDTPKSDGIDSAHKSAGTDGTSSGEDIPSDVNREYYEEFVDDAATPSEKDI